VHRANTPSLRSARAEFLAGVAAEAPILIGAVPLGIAFGVGSMASGLGLAATAGLSSIVFAGSSQFVAAQMLSAGAPWLLVTFTIVVVNLRHALYSASLAPQVASLSTGWKVVLSYLLTDEAFAVTAVYFEQHPTVPNRHWFFFGAGLTLWVGWQIGSMVGAVAGTAIPGEWNLDFMLPLVFIGLVVPLVRHRAALVTALVAAGLAVATSSLPFKLNIVVAIAGGLGAGMLARNRTT
jgi:4-azaleucine resistance transporter AzlC